MTILICPVVISENAILEIKKSYEHKKVPVEYGLRIGINGGGCSAISYFIGFDMQKEQDMVFNIEGVNLYIEKKHTMFLFGVKVDFLESGEERGFCFSND